MKIIYFLFFLITTSFIGYLEAGLQQCMRELPYSIRKNIEGRNVQHILQVLPPGYKESFSACLEPRKAAKEGKLVTALERVGSKRAQ